MFRVCRTNRSQQRATLPSALIGLLFATFISFTASTIASEESLVQAKSALANNDFKEAQQLFTGLSRSDTFKVEGLLGLAKVFLASNDLDLAEDHIEEVLDTDPNRPEYLFIAGRIAGKQAQAASIFSKLGYARKAKRYFSKALKINPQHQPSLIGLIRFHQQAPVMAGGEKEAIAPLIEQLRSIDTQAAFSIEAPILLNNGEIEAVSSRYQDALRAGSASNTEQFMFDYAMLLSSYGHYHAALTEMRSIDVKNTSKTADFATMRLYQLGKLAAESRSELELGIESMKQYSAIPVSDRAISQDWVEFRLAQLDALRAGTIADKQIFPRLRADTSDDALKTKITSFLKEFEG